MTELIAIAEARQRVLDVVRPLPEERVALGAALGRVLAEDVESPIDVPPFDSSAMDGFAVIAGPADELEVIGESRAGHPAELALRPGTAIMVSTGAAVPEGATAVVPVERTRQASGPIAGEAGKPQAGEGGKPQAGDSAPGVSSSWAHASGPVFVEATSDGANVRRAGEDVRAGQVVLRRGVPLGPAELGVAASVGRGELDCARWPRVALLVTGDELTEPGQPLAPGGIYSSNGFALGAQLQRAGAELAITRRVPDDAAATRTALADALDAADVVIVSGGVSVGPHDHVKDALRELEVEQRFWGVSLRPGKPTWFGTRGDTLAFGLPGNPVSAMVTLHLFVRPALAALQGADPTPRTTTAVLDEPIKRNPRREQAIRVQLSAGDDGWHASPTGPQGSHMLTSMLGAGALALIAPGEGEVGATERVEVELL